MRYLIPKYVYNNVSQTLNSSTYTTIFSQNGVGTFEYFEINFSDNGWRIKVVVDGITSLELSENDISNFSFTNADNNNHVKGNLILKNLGKDIFFKEEEKVVFNTSFSIQAKRIAGSVNCSRVLVHYYSEVEV